MKTFLSTLSVLIVSSVLFAQVPTKVFSDRTQATAYGKTVNNRDIVENGTEETTFSNTGSHSMVRNNSPFIGTSFWPGQSNGNWHTKVVAHDNGNVSVIWPTSTSSSATRGTGYNFFNGTSFGASSSDRIETERAGWGVIAALPNNGEIVVSHNGSTGLLINRRTPAGIGNWNQTLLTGPEVSGSHGVSTALLWPVVATVGDTVHIFAVTETDTSYVYGGFNGGCLVYYRSVDGGNTFDIRHRIIEGFDNTNFKGFSADKYQLSAREGVIVLGYGDKFEDLLLFKSVDGGATWTKKVVFDSPVNFDFDFNTQYFDTSYVLAGTFAMTIDDNKNAHVTFGLFLSLRNESNDPGYYTYWPAINTMVYWNETKPTIPTENNRLIPENQTCFDIPNLTREDTVYGFNSEYVKVPVYFNDFSYVSQANLISDHGTIYLIYSSILEYPFYDNATSQTWRGIFGTKSTDNGTTWNSKDNTSWLSYDPEFFYVNWGDYYQLLEENPALSPVEAMVTASEMQSENALPSVAQKIVNNKINISWLLSMVAGMPEQFPSTNEFSIIYKSFNKNDIGVINNINEVCYSKIADYSNSVKMNIYPNPATENVTIIVNSKDNAQAEMNITNMMGQVVYNQSIALSNGVNQFNVNVNSFSNGIYLVNIKTKNGVTAQKLIVR